ncbi:ig-like domain-containing protein [Caerostris extrusa]|uniref:Ig-like domain-containing protein n=1 Tax=Caerostris extrusa TaxID=172846 RepID=A0AAV4V933_CAEEX|nr:ig-like domain-containing protein [Caerostris extrusa]
MKPLSRKFRYSYSSHRSEGGVFSLLFPGTSSKVILYFPLSAPFVSCIPHNWVSPLWSSEIEERDSFNVRACSRWMFIYAPTEEEKKPCYYAECNDAAIKDIRVSWYARPIEYLPLTKDWPSYGGCSSQRGQTMGNKRITYWMSRKQKKISKSVTEIQYILLITHQWVVRPPILKKHEAHRNVLPLFPVCRFPEATTFNVVQGESVNITCDVESDPKPNTFQWTLNNTMRGTVDLKRRHPRTFHVLHYVPRYLGEYGTIMCWGKNSAGVQRVPCISHVVPEGKGIEIFEKYT